MKRQHFILIFVLMIASTGLFAYNKDLEDIQFDLAANLYTSERYDAAIEEFQYFMDRYLGSPKRSEASFLLGMSQMGNLDYELSTKTFTDTIKKYPRSSFRKVSLYYLARSYYLRDMRLEAVARFNQFMAEYPSDELEDNALFWKGMCAYKDQNKDLALAVMDTIITNYSAGNKVDAAKYMKLLITGGGPQAAGFDPDKVKELQEWQELLEIKEAALNSKAQLVDVKEKAVMEKETELTNASRQTN